MYLKLPKMAIEMLCMFLLEYAMRVEQSSSWLFYPENVMTVWISVLTVGKHPGECNRNSCTRKDMREATTAM
jgi:hypothetical protein